MSLAPPFTPAEEKHEILRSMAKVIDGRHRLWHEHNLNDLEDEVYARTEPLRSCGARHSSPAW
jgi:hypothetical protein